MTTIHETDQSTSTIAAAWASSPLGDPVSGPTELWETVEHAEADPPAAKPKSIARHAALVAALACSIGAGAALGLAVFDLNDSPQPTVMVPQVSAPSGGVPGANQAVPPKEAVPAPESAPGGNVVPSSGNGSGTNVALSSDAGAGSTDVGSPPASAPGDTTVIIDIPIPPLPDQLPEAPKPEPANPENPKTTLQQKPAGDPPALQPAPPQQFTPAPPKPKLTLEPTDPQTLGPKVEPTMQVPYKLQWPEP